MPVTGILSASPFFKAGVHAGCVIAELARVLRTNIVYNRWIKIKIKIKIKISQLRISYQSFTCVSAHTYKSVLLVVCRESIWCLSNKFPLLNCISKSVLRLLGSLCRLLTHSVPSLPMERSLHCSKLLSASWLHCWHATILPQDVFLEVKTLEM